MGSERIAINSIAFFVNNMMIDKTSRCRSQGINGINSEYINPNELCEFIPLFEKTAGESYDTKVSLYTSEDYSFTVLSDISICMMLRDLIALPGWLEGGTCTTNVEYYDSRGDFDKDGDIGSNDVLAAANCALYGSPDGCKAIMLDTCNPCEEACTPLSC